MYTVTYYHHEESHSIDLKPSTDSTESIVSQATEHVVSMTGSPCTPFEIKDSLGFIIMTDEDQ